MYYSNGTWLYSATDLSNSLACTELSLRSMEVAVGQRKAPPLYEDPSLAALREAGLRHEQKYLAAFRTAGKDVFTIDVDLTDAAYHVRLATAASATLSAMRSGADVIYQGALLEGSWGGLADFLRKVPKPSALGDWSYEVIDTKLARQAKGGALLQVVFYAGLLESIQGVAPDYVHLALGGPDPHTASFRVADYASYFRAVKARLLSLVEVGPASTVAPEPVEHCQVCRWSHECDRERHETDHLSLVSGITRRQRAVLAENSISTLADFAHADLTSLTKSVSLGGVSLENAHHQALVQLRGRETQRPLHEFIDSKPEEGLGALPEPHAADMFFDLEGDPFAFTHGVEYLFGYVDAHDDYGAEWAFSPEAERDAFEKFIDFVTVRLAENPGLHIYHYNHYETTALKRLMGRYNTRADELDNLLRRGVFVDLYRIVKQSIRASVEGYSIKRLEPFYEYVRDVNLREASHALASMQGFLQLDAGAEAPPDDLKTRVAGYNRDDCVSTHRLRDWLEARRMEREAQIGPLPRPVARDGEVSAEQEARDAVTAEVFDRLTAGLPVEVSSDHPEYSRWVMAHLLEFHRRERKSYWWKYFDRLSYQVSDALDDRKAVGGLELVGEVPDPAATSKTQTRIYRYRHLAQEHDLEAGDKALMRLSDEKSRSITVAAVDAEASTVDLKWKKPTDLAHPEIIFADENIPDTTMRESLLRLGRAMAEDGAPEDSPYRAAFDLLRRADQPCSVLPIQGPPGTGKTHTGAHLIIQAIRDGKRVGVTANSHKVITNLLDKVCSEAVKAGLDLRCIQRANNFADCHDHPWVTRAENNGDALAAIQNGDCQLVAGTAWLWSDENLFGSVDILVIDEAGQFSLANALAVAPAGGKMILLGDPQQLDQPMQGAHPPGIAVSALGHILGDHATLSASKGQFLDSTWRMHPDVCRYTSEAFYENKLSSRAGLEQQNVNAEGLFHGSGLRLITVRHDGNTSRSTEEAQVIRDYVTQLLSSNPTWTDADGNTRQMQMHDVVIVAPYNRQVAAIKRLMPDANVGTVDKFQGQEAPIAIYTMTASSAEDAPRGIGFLLSPNRLNVATSRGRCIAAIVASPELFGVRCRTPQQMKLANALCRFAEMSSVKGAALSISTAAANR